MVYFLLVRRCLSSPTTRSDFSPFYPESTVASAPSASLALTFGPDPDTPAEDEDRPMPSFHTEQDALDPSSLNDAFDANTVPTIPSPPLVTELNIATLSHSEQEPDVENTEDRPPDPSRYHHDMV